MHTHLVTLLHGHMVAGRRPGAVVDLLCVLAALLRICQVHKHQCV